MAKIRDVKKDVKKKDMVTLVGFAAFKVDDFVKSHKWDGKVKSSKCKACES